MEEKMRRKMNQNIKQEPHYVPTTPSSWLWKEENCVEKLFPVSCFLPERKRKKSFSFPFSNVNPIFVSDPIFHLLPNNLLNHRTEVFVVIFLFQEENYGVRWGVKGKLLLLRIFLSEELLMKHVQAMPHLVFHIFPCSFTCTSPVSVWVKRFTFA